MKHLLAARAVGAAVLAAGTVAAFTAPAHAAPAPQPKAATQLEAMQRDLHLTLQQATDRMHAEAIANQADHTLRGAL